MNNGTEIDGESQITLTRIIAANVSDVFAAWTDPALIEQWQVDEAEFDAFEGGQYHFVTYADEDDEADSEVSGEILQFVEDQRLVLSWVYKDEEDELIFVLDITFKAIGEDATSITLTERGLPHADAQTRIFSMEAWSAVLEQLAELME
ncbi:SRPBCC domain-containing protein [Devosia sp. YIM 151766]|uniref:SRPBCC family protein n=1 Tax=Devosia sp. YIM 151766 TaxID=3017325 RepID=UPI00255C4FFD|nr:SRPBCC domain-containing protein [Devosia sp. YIM 151766]WIY54097.1 SRPBCC domain-containing protein [Devosia sp. YIM 151766]